MVERVRKRVKRHEMCKIVKSETLSGKILRICASPGVRAYISSDIKHAMISSCLILLIFISDDTALHETVHHMYSLSYFLYARNKTQNINILA